MTKPTLTLTRVSNILSKVFENCIDMDDYADKPDQREVALLSRSLAAMCVKYLTSVDAKTAGAAVTDGYEDGGIDALYFDQNTDRLIFVESKWSQDGSKPINGKSKSTADFVDSVILILQGKIDRFNDKIAKKQAEIRAALYSQTNIKIVLVAAATSAQPMGHAKPKIEDLVERLNADGVPIASAEYFDLARVYQAATTDSAPPKIQLGIYLRDWGLIQQPFLAYTGKVHILEVTRWWRDHDRALCHKNLRHLLQRSDVNDALRQTLTKDPEDFWYFNNGITIVCESIDKSLANAGDRRIGFFNCKDISIVNGAQTVGTIGTTIQPIDLADPQKVEETGAQGWVQVRIIQCPPGFEREITRATNFQNSVGKRDFAAMDPVQHRLAAEFALDQRRYVVKSGDADPQGVEGCSITEATQALACARPEVDLAVQVKREIGALWDSTEAKPYIDLFNDSLTAVTVWRSVLVMRAVESELYELRKRPDVPRADLLGIHLHRVILYLVFRDPNVLVLNHDDTDIAALVPVVIEAARRIFPRVAEYIEIHHRDEYLAMLAKNTPKCAALAAALVEKPRTPKLPSEEFKLTSD